MLFSTIQSLLATIAFVLASPSAERVVDEAAISRLSAPEQELVREYAREWPRVFEFYSSMEFEGAIRDERRADKNSEYVIVSEFQGTAKILNNKMFRVAGRMPDGSSGMVIATDKDVYGFLWNEEKQKYFLGSRFKTDSVFMDDYISQYAFHIETFSNGEFQRLVFGVPQAPNQTVTLERMEATEENGEEIVKAHLVCRGSNKGVDWCRIELFSFLRNHSWAKHEVISAFPNDATRTYSLASTRCIYDGEINGIPILKECIRQSGEATYSNAAVDRCREYSPGEVTYGNSRSRAYATKFVPGPPDLSEFDPSPYLKEIGGLGRTTITSRWSPALLLANAAFLLIVGIILSRRRRPSSKGESKTPESGGAVQFQSD